MAVDTVESTKVSPGADLRDWLAALEERNLLRHVKAEVNWDRELGQLTRAVQAKYGPALLFENIKDYDNTLCRRLFTNGLGTLERLNLCLGLPAEASHKDAIQFLRKAVKRGIPPVIVEDAPVHENVLLGDDVDLFQLPVPRWHHLDGGRYIDTFCGIVTKDPETGFSNMGLYRGQLVSKNKIAKLLLRTQDWGKHYTKWEARGKPMPIAIVYGMNDLLTLMACQPWNHDTGFSEYDMAGAIIGEPLKLVKCKTVDLEVPAGAEIVVEGHISGQDLHMEGPFGEFTGYLSDTGSPKPTVTVDCMTYRNDPIFRGCIEGMRPGMPNESTTMVMTSMPALAWNSLEDAGVPGVTDVTCPPNSGAINVYVQIHKQYRGHAKQVAHALWGTKAAGMFYKNVMVVEEDIDIRDLDAMDWALAYRVNAGEGGVIISEATNGDPLDPSTRREDNNAALYGTGKWRRMLIDATRNWEYPRVPEWDNNVYPPVNKMSVEDERLIRSRWDEYDLGIPPLTEDEREVLTMEKLMKILPAVGTE